MLKIHRSLHSGALSGNALSLRSLCHLLVITALGISKSSLVSVILLEADDLQVPTRINLPIKTPQPTRIRLLVKIRLPIKTTLPIKISLSTSA